MKMWFAILILLLVTKSLYGADHYQPGDVLYVWAHSGLKLRSGPGIKTKKISWLKFGTKLTIIEKTVHPITLLMVEADSLTGADPLNFKGYWVKVRASDGQEGYVYDQYLLKYSPSLFSKPLAVDTISNIISDTEVGGLVINYFYEHGITQKIEVGLAGVSDEFYPNMNMEEASLVSGSN